MGTWDWDSGQATIPLGMESLRGMGWGNITEREVTCSLFPRSLQVEPRCRSILSPPSTHPCTFEHFDPLPAVGNLERDFPTCVLGLELGAENSHPELFPLSNAQPLFPLSTHTEMRTSTCYGTPALLQTGSRPSDSRLHTAWPQGAKGSEKILAHLEDENRWV